jgi:hypothetical protein
LKLLPETQAIISQVEAITDRPVQVVEISDLPVMATMHVARDGAPSHRLACRPEGDVLDYQVATQCANVLRLYRRPPSARFNFGSDRKNVSAIEAMLRDTSASPPDETHLRRVAGVIFDWLLLSLRSHPVSMRIDLWLWEEYPALRPQIELALGRQMQENVTAATKSLDGLSIPPAFRVLPAAYARFTDRLLGSDFYSIPFETMSLMAGGDALLAIWDRMPTSPLSDNELIDAWAKQLGILGWYVWLPFRE